MQTIWPALPKFDSLWLHSKTTPVRRQRNRAVCEALFHFFESRVKHAPNIDGLALRRRPRAELRTNRPAMKIFSRFLARRFFDGTLNSNLALNFHPVKNKGDVWIFFQLLSFLARVIGKENETALIKVFQKNNSR